MDIKQLIGKLKDLGVTLCFSNDKDQSKFKPEELILDRQYRASLYLTYLTDTQEFLDRTLKSETPLGLGENGYKFCAEALKDRRLLNELAASIDQWICPAIERAINNYITACKPETLTAADWFDHTIFADDDGQYPKNVQCFFTEYTITKNALDKITENFQRNLATACQRIWADRSDIGTLFSDGSRQLTLTGLTEITSSGSDFHKGGQQVLLLTFSTSLSGGCYPATSTLKLVYKPADLEVDCLIAGEAEAVNRVAKGTFMKQSLIEIINEITRSVQGTEQLPTYKILPLSRTSQLPDPTAELPLALRQAYGYSEFLGHSLNGLTFGEANNYSFGASDYLIYRKKDEPRIVRKFYHQLGQLLALAVTFSLTDLHGENVRATRFQPHFIDLEACLTAAIANVTETALFGEGKGGIDGESITGKSVLFCEIDRMECCMNKALVTTRFENRLSQRRPDVQVIPVQFECLQQGLEDGMQLLSKAQQDKKFDPWFTRLDRVLVRILPFGTDFWQAILDQVYDAQVSTVAVQRKLDDVLKEQLMTGLRCEFRRYDPKEMAEPSFIALAASQTFVDFQNFDIPAFYHRIGTSDMLDSAGNVVAVPRTIVIDNVTCNTRVDRTAYFNEPPTKARVQQGQVGHLSGKDFDDRCAELKSQCTRELDSMPARAKFQIAVL